MDKNFVSSIQADVGVLPIIVRRELVELDLSVDEQDVLIGQSKTMQIFQATQSILSSPELVKKAVNWLVGDYQAWLTNSTKPSQLTGDNLAELISLVDKGEISSKIAKEIFPEVMEGQKPTDIIEGRGLKQVSDSSELEAILKTIITQNPKAVEDYKSGNERALGFFVGQAMKATQGQANPGKVNELVVKLLKE